MCCCPNNNSIIAKIDVFVFFFKQKTAYEVKECDWSSDVCSSDLIGCNTSYRCMDYAGDN